MSRFLGAEQPRCMPYDAQWVFHLSFSLMRGTADPWIQITRTHMAATLSDFGMADCSIRISKHLRVYANLRAACRLWRPHSSLDYWLVAWETHLISKNARCLSKLLARSRDGVSWVYVEPAMRLTECKKTCVKFNPLKFRWWNDGVSFGWIYVLWPLCLDSRGK
jgi:hypothetical protein